MIAFLLPITSAMTFLPNSFFEMFCSLEQVLALARSKSPGKFYLHGFEGLQNEVLCSDFGDDKKLFSTV